ncbi:MAG: hypothetical protein IJO99_02760 [Ruminococcus sp.]|nr:hypothetical protein [Ruminococcus sp.]MBQ9956467.1 hypothetical protein [Ruminococcus sp.]MBR6792620.1 hypothetical protein [Ruminococcus sp.]
MQRKFLEDLGLEKDVIDKIMTENGNDINNAKKKLEAERDNYKSPVSACISSINGACIPVFLTLIQPAVLLL